MLLPPIGHSFKVFASIDSTNLYAMNRIREGLAVHGEAFYALEQTKGKGQRGRKWWSAPGENLQMTVVINPLQLTTSQAFRLSATVACAVHDFLTKHSSPGWSIKWPNDLYRGDRKAGGILIENVFQANQWTWAVIGIGININATVFPSELSNPTSLKIVAGQDYDVEAIAKDLCNMLDHRFSQLADGGWKNILADYNRALFGVGHVHRLKIGAATAAYEIKRVDEQGHLVAGQHGEYHFRFGEVEWILPPPVL